MKEQYDSGCKHAHHAQEDPHPHEHSHSHEERGIIHISCHEEAIIGSVRGRLAAPDLQTAQALLSQRMRQIGQQICEQGGIIGHIKFLVSSPEHCCQISLTDTAESCRYFDADSCQAEGVAIVFQLEEERLRNILDAAFSTILTAADG